MNTPKNLLSYTSEEAASILTRALDQQHDGGRISHDELLETAREIGVTTLEIEAAVAEEVKARAERMVQEEARAKGIRLFAKHLAVFVVANALLAVVDVKLWGGVVFYWVGLVWGALLALHAARALAPLKALSALPAAPTPTRIEVRGGKMEMRSGSPQNPGHTASKKSEDTRDASSVRRRANR